MHTDPRVDAYIATLPRARQDAVRQLRDLLSRSLPDAREDIVYGMPGVRVTGGQVVCSYKSQKQYISLYLDVGELDARREAFAKLNCGKSCVRFTSFDRLPVEAVAAIVQATARQQRDAADRA